MLSMRRFTCCGMRAALVALLIVLSTPAFAGGCRYVSQAGQSIIWDGKSDRIVWDPAYTDPVECLIVPIKDTNGFDAFCGGTWKWTFMPIASTSTSSDVDIVIFKFIAYWLKCVNGA